MSKIYFITIKKWYNPQVNIDEIKEFQSLYFELYDDVKKGIETLIETVSEKAGKKGEVLAIMNYNTILYEQVEEYCKIDSEFENKFFRLVEKANKIYEDNPPTDDDLNTLPLL